MTFDPRSLWAAMELARSAMPPVSVEVGPGMVRVAVRWAPSEEELLSRFQELLREDSPLPESPLVLCDNREHQRIVSAAFIGNAVEAAREHATKLAGARIAFVAASTVQFGMQRMFCLGTESFPFAAQAFMNLEAARHWLLDPETPRG